MRVVTACEEDIVPWLALASEVEDLFGVALSRDPGFLTALRRNVARGSAFCVRAGDEPPGAELCGGLLFSSRHAPVYELSWLAVGARWRRLGVARALVEHAAGLITPPAELEVTTFVAGEPGGEPARKFYAGLGFAPGEVIVPDVPPLVQRQVFRKNIV